MNEIIHEVEHTPLALQKDVHTCSNEGCTSFNSYRQSKRINLINDYEDYLIRHFQAIFIIKSKLNKETLLIKYYFKLTYILYKYGKLGVIKLSYSNDEKKPYFGILQNYRYDVRGDITKFDIAPKLWGYIQSTDNYILTWEKIKLLAKEENDYFAIELPRKKGLKSQYYNLISSCNDAYDNIRIDQDNTMIKFYAKFGYRVDGFDTRLRTSPSIDNMGIATLQKELIPNYNPKNMSLEELAKIQDSKLSAMANDDEDYLIPNQYQNTLSDSWLNFENHNKLLSKFAGLRENRDIKKANLTEDEVENNYFSNEVIENYILQTIQELVNKWNKVFGEDNYIVKQTPDNSSNIINGDNNDN